MTTQQLALLAAFLSPIAAAIKIDVSTYRAAKKKDRSAAFDWSLFGLRLADGALAGFGAVVTVLIAAGSIE